MKCYACDRRIGTGTVVYTSDDGQQQQLVGSECYVHVKDAGAAGWQPPKGGPRLFAHKADAAASGVSASDGETQPQHTKENER